MDKGKLLEIKKSLLTVGIYSLVIGFSGCGKTEKSTMEEIPIKYSKVEEYYKYIVRDDKAIKMYDSQNVYLVYNKETYDVEEYIYNDTSLGGVELYDLESEEMLVYGNGLTRAYNKEYYESILDNYQVSLADASDYIENHIDKEYYSLEEIKELELQIKESLKIINKEKIKTR